MANMLKNIWSAMTFFVLASFISIQAAYGDFQSPETLQCLQSICTQGSGGAEPLKSFLDREKVIHPDLDKTMTKYQSRIDQVRENRKQRMGRAITFFSQPEALKQTLGNSTDSKLLELFLLVRPWNTVKVFKNGTVQVAAEPLDPVVNEKSKLVRTLFEKFMKVSPLFKLQMDYLNLHVDVYNNLGIRPKADLQTAILEKINSSSSELMNQDKKEFQMELQRSLNILKISSRLFGKEASVILGELELINFIKTGKITLSPSEHDLLVDIVFSQFNENLSEKIQIDLNKIYQKADWDNKCRKAFNRTLHYGLSEKDAQNINFIKAEAINRAKQASMEIFGVKTSTELLKYFMAVDIVGPLSQDAYFEYINGIISLELSNSSANELSALYKIFFDLRREGDAGLESICNSFIYEPIRDQENGGSVALSTYSVRNVKMGLSIATHEMGHAASEGLKAMLDAGDDVSEFIKMRTCINNNYASIDRPLTRLPGDKLWTEEDWADAFSGYCVRDIKVINTCTFLGAFPQYDFVQTKDRGEDPHSPTFYRILNVNIHAAGSNPNQCSEAVAKEFSGTKFVNCLSPQSQYPSP